MHSSGKHGVGLSNNRHARFCPRTGQPLGVVGSAVAFRKAERLWRQSRQALALAYLAVAVVFGTGAQGPLSAAEMRRQSPVSTSEGSEESVPATGIIAPGAEVRLLSESFRFTEGPAADADGNIYFTDQPNDRICKWSVDGKLTDFMKPCGRSNGMFFDRQGNLWTCADMNNQLWKIDPNGNVTVVVKDFKGKLLNGPNDLWMAPDGGIYFTDPLYRRDYWTRDPAMQQDGQHVYYLSPDRQTLIRVTEDLRQPNGIVGTPDGKLLYIADIGARKTYRYKINEDATLSEKALFCSMGSDGMTLDGEGNVYLTGRGVTVFNPQGEQIEQIPIREGWTANVCFGGKDRHTLFITASDCLYALQMRVKGAY